MKQNQQRIQSSIQELIVDKTVIIAHRLSTIQNTDVIHLIDRGRILSSGTHAQLLAASNEYRELIQAQKGASI